jgi:hypothetical protein
MSEVEVPMSSAVMYAPCVAPLRPAVVDHHRLSATEIEARGRRLERHRARETHHVVERFAKSTGIPLEPHSAQCGAEHRRVDGDDEAKACLRILAYYDLLVVVLDEVRG